MSETMRNQKKEKLDQARDTGMALCLLLLLLIYFGKYYQLVPVAILLLVLSMAWPKLFHPMSRGWLKFSFGISSIMSRFILTFLFFGIVTPVGLLMRLRGTDLMQFKKWKNGNGSVLSVRNKLIERKDLEHPY